MWFRSATGSPSSLKSAPTPQHTHADARKRQGVETALDIGNPDRLLNIGSYLFQAGDDYVRLARLKPHCERKDTVFQGLIAMPAFEMVHRFMGKVVKKAALILEIIKKGPVVQELEKVLPSIKGLVHWPSLTYSERVFFLRIKEGL